MPKKTKHIKLSSGKSTLALEQPYWNLIDYLSKKDGYDDWRDWFYRNGLFSPTEGLSITAYVRMKVALFLFDDLEQSQGKQMTIKASH